MITGWFPEKRALRQSIAIACFVTVFANLSLEYFEREQKGLEALSYIPRCFSPFSLGELFMFSACTALAYYVFEKRLWRHWGAVHVLPSLLFSFFMVEGHYFEVTNAIDFFSAGLFVKALCSLYFAAYAIFYYLVFLSIDDLLCSLLQHLATAKADDLAHNKVIRMYLSSIEYRPFLTSFATLIACFIPLAIVSYPALFVGDCPSQIPQALNSENFQPYLELIDDNIKLFNHHPITHTLLIRLCLWVGSLLSLTDNASIFIYVLFQGFISCYLYAVCIKICVTKLHASPHLAAFCVLFYAFHPRTFTYLVQITKDTIYCAMFTLLICLLYAAIKKRSMSRKSALIMLILGLGTILFRNDGIYLVLTLFVLSLAYRELRKPMVPVIACVVTFWFAWGHLILPAFSITPGSIREMLSIPLQQTARYVTEHQDDVTEDEREAIDAIMSYDLLVEKYDPVRSDSIKRCFRESATRDDLKKYFSAWASMFKRHPESYIRATLNNKYQYFYPSRQLSEPYSYFGEYGAGSRGSMDSVNSICETEFSHPEALLQAQQLFEYGREAFFRMPVLRLFVTSYAYILAILFIVFFCLRHLKWNVLLMTAPMIVQIAIIIAGPTNGYYFRYTVPIAMLLPFLVLFLSLEFKQTKPSKHMSR